MKDHEEYYKSGNCYDTSFVESHMGIKYDQRISYFINEQGHRSDLFSKNLTGKHILFGGCSVTFGEGLPYKMNWSGKTYDKISSKEQMHGFNNLSYPGAGIDFIINNVYKYCSEYGNPDLILLYLPELARKYHWYSSSYYGMVINGEYRYQPYHNRENAKYFAYYAIKNFELFCKNSNINLIWSTWQQDDLNEYESMGFDNLLVVREHDIFKASKNYHESSDKYFDKARDGSHPGLAYSDGLSNLFIEEIYEKNYL
jgi:hypothetical protein